MKLIPRQPRFLKKGGVSEPLSLISGFSLKRAHSHLLCVDLNWRLWTLLLQPQTAAFLLPENQHIYLELCCYRPSLQDKLSTMGSSVRHVWPIDRDRPTLVCSREPVFEFVLGEVPDRLAGPTGKLQSQRGPEAQLVLGAAAFTCVSGRTLPQPMFNQRFRAP